MPTFPSPVAFVRNAYGDDAFEHVEHWMTLGLQTGWEQYETGSFSSCSVPGHHACLDQYFPAGNLQFLDVLL